MTLLAYCAALRGKKKNPVRANKLHALGGGTTLEFNISNHWPTANDVIR